MKLLLPVFLSGFLLVGCGLFKKEAEEAPEPSPNRIIGEVTSVHVDHKFLLFRRYGPGSLQTGSFYSARSVDGRRAVGLVPSGEKLGKFYAADYSDDTELPRVGDLIVVSELDLTPKRSNLVTKKIKKTSPSLSPESP